MLILRLQQPDDQEFAYTLLGDNALFSDWAYGTWVDAVRLAGNQAVTLFIPTREVLLTHTGLSTTNARQIRQALPFALEENLVGELEQQHFVWQEASNGGLDVAVIEHERLGTWIAVLRQHKLRVRTILPDVFILPWSDGQPTIWQRNGQVWVRTGAHNGFSCPADAAPILIDGLFEDDDTERSAQIYSDVPSQWANDLKAVAEPYPQRLTRRYMEDALGLNLLKGYQDKSVSVFQNHWKRWRPVVIAASLVLMIGAGLQVMQTLQLKRQVDASNQHNLALFHALFPDIQGVTAQDIRSRTLSEMQKLNESSAKPSVKISPMPYLASIGKSFQQDNRLKITELRIRNNKISLAFTAPDLQIVDKLQQDLKQNLGKEVEIKSNQTGKEVRAQFELEMAS